MATAAEVRKQAGLMLGIVTAAESLRSEHDTLLTRAYTQVYDQIKDEGLNIWASTGTIPDRVAPHVAALMAFNVCDDVGVPETRYARVLARRNVAMPEIRKYVTPAAESLEEPTDY